MPNFTRRKFLAHGAGFGAILLGGNGLSRGSSKVSVGVAGLGIQGRNHLRALSRLASAHVAAICDPDPRALRTGGRILSNRAALFADFRRLLDRADIDLVAITAAPLERMPMIEKAVQAGKHVVVEQLGALSLEEAARLHALATSFPISVEHFPSDPAWDGQALLPWLSLDQPRRVEIQVLRDDSQPDSALDEFEIAARLLASELPHRTVALTAVGLPGWDLSAEIGLGAKSVALHQSRRALPRGIERRVMIAVENARESAAVMIDSWREECEPGQPLAAWARAIAAIANGNRACWTASTERTAVASAMVHMLAAARASGEFTWSRD